MKKFLKLILCNVLLLTISLSTYSNVQGQNNNSKEKFISPSHQDTTAKDPIMVKVDSVLNQAIKDAVQSDMRLAVIHEKDIQLNLKEELLSQIRHKYLDCVQSNDTQLIALAFAKQKINRQSRALKVIIFVDVGLIVGSYFIIKNNY